MLFLIRMLFRSVDRVAVGMLRLDPLVYSFLAGVIASLACNLYTALAVSCSSRLMPTLWWLALVLQLVSSALLAGSASEAASFRRLSEAVSSRPTFQHQLGLVATRRFRVVILLPSLALFSTVLSLCLIHR
jgi:hypothetical protein